MHKKLLLSIVTLFFATQACASDVSVSDVWIRASAPGQDSAAVSLHITSQKDSKLIAASSPLSDSAQIHTMKHENGMMIMRQLDALPLPSKQDVALDRNGHIMLIGLKKPLIAGDSVPLTLTIEYSDKTREKISVKADVKPMGETHNMHDMPDMPDMPGMH